MYVFVHMYAVGWYVYVCVVVDVGWYMYQNIDYILFLPSALYDVKHDLSVLYLLVLCTYNTYYKIVSWMEHCWLQSALPYGSRGCF